MTKRLTPEQKELLANWDAARANVDPAYMEAIEVAIQNQALDNGFLGTKRSAQIVALLREVLPSDKFEVVGGAGHGFDGVCVGMHADGEEPWDGWPYWYFDGRAWDDPKSDYIEAYYTDTKRDFYSKLDNTKWGNPLFEADSLTIAKWIVSIVTADIDLEAQS